MSAVLEHFSRDDDAQPSGSLEKLVPPCRHKDKVRDVLRDIRDVQSAQLDILEQISQIRRENSELYDSVGWIQLKVRQQQTILDKLVNFLMTMAGIRRSSFLKRSLAYCPSSPERVMKRFRSSNDKQAGLESELNNDCTDSSFKIPVLTKTIFENSPAQVKSELEEVVMGMDLDITGLKDLLMSKALAELPKQTIDQLFDPNSEAVPPLPTASLQESRPIETSVEDKLQNETPAMSAADA